MNNAMGPSLGAVKRGCRTAAPPPSGKKMIQTYYNGTPPRRQSLTVSGTEKEGRKSPVVGVVTPRGAAGGCPGRQRPPRRAGSDAGKGGVKFPCGGYLGMEDKTIFL